MIIKPSEIRRQFIDFFRERGHTFVPSAPVVPHGDPTLLFTNAGMNQFKDVFLELGTRPYSRAVNAQKCIRVSGKHNDLEEVGPSPTHHTFFEMLGNWSFGDYYKREAVRWAWELVTGVWKIDPARLYPTVFSGDEEVPRDEEALQAWVEETGMPEERVSFHGRKDNFWEMGEVGPCGPCSEIHYDLGPQFCRRRDDPSHRCAVNGGCGRIVELWNLVFIQYHRDQSGVLRPLPRRHVDTGAGFERVMMVLEGVRSTFETGLFAPLVAYIAELSGVPYYPDHRGIPHRVAADHIRMLAFALADGVLPSNEGRGYVLRRVLRRAARFGWEIGLEGPYLYKLVEPLVTVMGDDYPELKERRSHILGVVKAEEESFARTLGRGLEIFGGVVARLQAEGGKVISGEDAFKLYDTYGFPLDLTELMARERGFQVDQVRFQELMEQQRLRARGGAVSSVTDLEPGAVRKSKFIGYDSLDTTAEVLNVQPTQDGAAVVLDVTPFYAESGGQVSDSGWIEAAGGRFEVVGVEKVGDAVVHLLKSEGGANPTELIRAGEPVTARVDAARRIPTQANHTATHLLHKALRTVLGPHASQQGSLVAPDRLRFDFTHYEKIDPERLEDIERRVNAAVRADYPVKWYELPYREALDRGVVALFGEKYGEVVRVVQVGDDSDPYSRELCGGCHVRRTGEIGLFRIVSEGSLSAGVRRIEAVTGAAALEFTLSEHRGLRAMVELLGSHGSDPVAKLQKALEERKVLEREHKRLLEDWARRTAEHLLAQAIQTGDVRVVARHFEGLELERLKLVGDWLRQADARAVALLTTAAGNGSGQLCCVVGEALVSRGLSAGDLVARAAKVAGGGGGGRSHMATAGTKLPDRLPAAVRAFPELVRQALSGK